MLDSRIHFLLLLMCPQASKAHWVLLRTWGHGNACCFAGVAALCQWQSLVCMVASSCCVGVLPFTVRHTCCFTTSRGFAELHLRPHLGCFASCAFLGAIGVYKGLRL